MPFRGIAKNGRLVLGPVIRVRFVEWLTANDGKTVVIAEEKRTRSRSQNAYYWVYLGIIAAETGDNADDLHEFFKRKLLPPRFVTVQGQEVKLPASTTDLNKADFGNYLDKICAMTNVPLPDPEAAGYITNYEPRK
jgi:hypothetical protein